MGVAVESGRVSFPCICNVDQVAVSMRERRSQIAAAIKPIPATAPIQMPGVASIA